MATKSKLWLLFLIGFILYLPSFWNQFLWDDEQFIYRNAYVREFNVAKIFSENTIAGAGELSNYYRPLTTLSFAIDNAIWGLRPFGFHLTNTVLHSLNGVLLYLLLTKLDIFRKAQRLKGSEAHILNGPFLISVLFLVHPLQTEAVTYVNSRGDSLYVFFTLLGLLSFWKILNSYLLPHPPTGGSKVMIGDIMVDIPPATLYCLPPLFFILSILSKEIAIATLGLYFLIFFNETIKQFSNVKILITQKPSHLATLFGLTTLAFFYLYLRSTILNFNNSFNFYGGSNIYTDSLLVRLITFIHILWEYFRLLLLPYPLHMERSPVIQTELFSVTLFAFCFLLFTLLGVIYWEWKKHHTLTIFFGITWFFLMLAPVSGIVPINGLMYEHWLYLPMVGFFISVLRLLQLVVNQWNNDSIKQWRLLLHGCMVSLILILGILTLRQNYLWNNPIRFYEYTLRYTSSARLHNNLAMAYSDVQRHEDAIREYTAAIAEADFYPQTHYNLARTYLELNDLKKGEAELLKTIELSPQFYLAHQLLIELYLHQQRFKEAEKYVDELLTVEPTNRQLLQLKNELVKK